MKAKEIYVKTMKFVWAKLLMGAAVLLASLILLGIFAGIGALISKGTGMGIAILLWIISIPGLYSLFMHYFGYLIKAGHVAVIAEICSTGSVPGNMLAYGKEKVRKRFAASNVYFLVDRLVSRAVSQIQKGVTAVGNLIDAIPGAGFLTGFAKTFISISLNYVDECCLGWCFLHEDENAFKASCDGIVIYFRNIKRLLKSAAVTSLIVIAVTLASWLIPLIVLGGVFRLLHWSTWIAVIISIVIALIIKSAFIDSWMMIKMMCTYMETAESTEVTVDIYQKLCGISSSFRKLSVKAKEPDTEAAV